MNTNIDDYSKDELLDMFDIENDTNITTSHILTKCKSYIDNIDDSEDINYEEKKMLVEFLNKGMNKLVNVYNNLSENNAYNNLENSNVHDDHLVIQQNSKNNLTSKINPISTNKIYRYLNINTVFRQNYYNTKPSNFTIDINDNLNNVTSIALESAEIPNLFYNFSSLNKTNEFTIELFDVSDNVSNNANSSNNVDILNKTKRVIKIKDGNYTAQQLTTYLNRFIFGISGDELSRVAAEFDENTGKIHFIRDIRGKSNGGIPVVNLDGDGIEKRFNIDFRLSSEPNRPIQMNMGWILGYRKQYYSYANDFVENKNANTMKPGRAYSPEGVFDTIGAKYLFIAIDDFNNNYAQTMMSPFQESVFNNNMVLAKLVSNGNNYNYRNGEIDKFAIRKYFGPVNINKLKITILDELGRVVDFNNTDYSISLRIEQLYDLNKKNF